MTRIIQVSNLSKSYNITHESREKYTSLRDVIARRANKIFSFPKSLSTTSATNEEFWALKDLSFDIEKGDRVGIIGRNGAGKSTLLKILSRITEPTSGEIKIRGRVASLLEVGTGFHPELTGRENIYLNGAILGMSRFEIKKHFDDIVAFAEVEKFLDTPVKRYSSGMYVRLAFAVAAHLEPEILIVDEVLAVGDAQFQKKCLGKMEDVSKNEGRTVIFVSHNMEVVKNLCKKGIVITNGELSYNGGSYESVLNYSQQNYKNILNTNILKRIDREGIGEIKFQDIWIEDKKDNVLTTLAAGDLVKFKVKTSRKDFKKSLYCSIVIKTIEGVRVCTLSSEMMDKKVYIDKCDTFVFEIERFPLSENEYVCDLRMAEKNDDLVQDSIKEVFKFRVIGNDYFKSGQPQGSNIDIFFTDFRFYAE